MQRIRKTVNTTVSVLIKNLSDELLWRWEKMNDSARTAGINRNPTKFITQCNKNNCVDKKTWW